MKFKIWGPHKKDWISDKIKSMPFFVDAKGELFYLGASMKLVKAPEDLETIFSIEVHDKNGVELFDGDIVKCHKFTQEVGENLGVVEGEKEFIAVIEFSRYGGIRLKNKDGEFMFLWEFEEGWHEESLEKIGNKFENPELLKEKPDVS